ncbi:MAG: tetratricopeptide repeat protein [Ignavibacteriales bacterium]
MPKSTKDIFAEKLALVFEYNRKSPLFVRAAGLEIEKNNLLDAVKILNGGLLNYPDYPTAYILLGKAQMLLGNFDQAEDAFQKGCQLIHSRESLNFYISELEKKRKKHSHITESRRVAFFPDNFLMEEGKIVEIAGPEPESKQDEIKNLPEETFYKQDEDTPGGSIEERLDDLAKEISSVKISVSESDKEEHPGSESKDQSVPENTGMASETLAKIYISQGKFREALAVYKQLLLKSPEKAAAYQIKINEIESQLDDEAW